MNHSSFNTNNTNVLIATTQSEIDQINKMINKLPPGSANVYVFDGRVRYKGTYQGTTRYFTNDELPLAKKLIYRKYLETKKEELICRVRFLTTQKEYEENGVGLTERFLNENPERTKLLMPVIYHADRDLYHWMTAPEANAAPFQELRTEEAPGGLMVRSKSEVLIVVVLIDLGLPFRYEEPLNLSGKMYYPDFTIRDPKTGKTFYYEHFGKMGDPKYVRDNYEKLEDYALHGIIPSINLLATFETKDDPLTIPKIKHALSLITG